MLIIKNLPLLKTNKYEQFFCHGASSTTGLNTISIWLQRRFLIEANVRCNCSNNNYSNYFVFSLQGFLTILSMQKRILKEGSRCYFPRKINLKLEQNLTLLYFPLAVVVCVKLSLQGKNEQSIALLYR